jgi:hypothetical protein
VSDSVLTMGLLSEGQPLTWEETKRFADHVRKHGVQVACQMTSGTSGLSLKDTPCFIEAIRPSVSKARKPPRRCP